MKVASNELEQWCFIDGHRLNTFYRERGLTPGEKTTEIVTFCVNCYCFIEHKYLISSSSKFPVIPIPYKA